MLQTFSNSLKCRYGFSDLKLWKIGRSWMILGLKLKCDAWGGKDIHDGDYVLVRCMKPLSVLGCSWRFCKVWLSSCFEKLSASMSAMSKGDEDDFLINLPLSVQDQHRMQCKWCVLY